MPDDPKVQLREQVKDRYAAAAAAVLGAGGRTALEVLDGDGCCSPSRSDGGGCCSADTATLAADAGAVTTPAGASLADDDAGAGAGAGAEKAPRRDTAFGAHRYGRAERDSLPVQAVDASLGCGNPLLVADLHEGETVLDLGSGGGIDVLLSARRVGPRGFAYGVDLTPEMLQLARENAERSGMRNVEFLQGTIEALPLPEASVDVVISNCVVNLATDKAAVLTEVSRVLRPGGRVGISDVVAEDHLSPAERARRGSFVGCIAGALSRKEYVEGLAAVGLVDVEVTFTAEVAPGMHTATVRAVKPA